MLADLILLAATGLATTIKGFSKSSRIALAIFAIILILFGVAGIVLHEASVVSDARAQRAILIVSIFLAANGLGGMLLIGASYASVDLLSLSGEVQDKIEINGLQRERKAIVEEVSGGSSGDIFQSIRLSLNELREYYVINKTQGRKSFAFSVSAVVIGLFLIVIGICIVYFDKSAHITVPVIAVASGLLSQFIGATSFYIYKKTLDQLNHYFQQLTDTQRIMLAIQISKEASDHQSQDALRSIIVAALMNPRFGCKCTSSQLSPEDAGNSDPA